jgi:SpoVK/Ycf46/Vps4 family AAA+-type ATPase
MVTANNVTGLPPELLRRGRFDAIFSTSLPTPRERREVLRIHLDLRGRDLTDYPESDIVTLVNALNGYVPAEIESVVKDGLVDAFSAGEEFSMAHVRKAADSMVPLSKAFAAQIGAMSEWAKNNATPASKTDDELKPVANAQRVLRRQRTDR